MSLHNMGWSKSTRIKMMLAIDVMFFLLELTVGLAVGSLALMADAFHMLNDIISLLVGLWAVVVARKATTDKYSYGWLRAEILGAFFNAVFLIALCVSIVLDAVNRFIDPPQISNPQLILIVGCLGLASNLVGFLVLGGHGHSHGPGDHSHGEDGHSHADELHSVEQGRAGILDSERSAADENGRVADILPEAAVARYNTASPEVGRHIRFDHADGARSGSRISARSRGRDRRRGSCRLTSIDDLSIHPASFRQEIIAASRPQPDDESSSESSIDENAVLDETEPREDTPLLKKDSDGKEPNGAFGRSRSHSRRPRRDSATHIQHHHNKPKKPTGKSGHGHSHGDMGMNAMILHVIGDALGNVGVIVTALVIWLTDWPGRFYADPTVSLFITLIILRSTIPLTVATAKILLQATPESIDLNDVREDIQALPGVISCHHVHIWQLSDTNIVASMHIKLAFPISEANGARYMEVAKQARKCLHAYGIHSATIQPEFCLDASHDHGEDAALQVDGSAAPKPACAEEEGSLCMLECVDNCVGKGCCSGTEPRPGSRTSAHDHDRDHDHSQ